MQDVMFRCLGRNTGRPASRAVGLCTCAIRTAGLVAFIMAVVKWNGGARHVYTGAPRTGGCQALRAAQKVLAHFVSSSSSSPIGDCCDSMSAVTPEGRSGRLAEGSRASRGTARAGPEELADPDLDK